LFTALAAPVCVGLTTLGAQRLDLFHLEYFDACANHAYAIHTQDQRRLPESIDFDFALSPDSLVVLEVWLEDGPRLGLSRALPWSCATAPLPPPAKRHTVQ
jgi:hypothetical protein